MYLQNVAPSKLCDARCVPHRIITFFFFYIFTVHIDTIKVVYLPTDAQ